MAAQLQLVFSQNSPRSPAFRQKGIEEVLWNDSSRNPAWVKTEPSVIIPGPAHGDISSVPAQAPGRDCNRMAGLNQAQLSIGLQSGGRGRTSSMATVVETRPREGVNKNSSGTCGYVRTLCKAGRLKDALHILNQQGIRPDSSTYVCLLQECIKIKDLAEGKQIHAHIIQSGFKPTLFLLNKLVNMYAECGSVVDARQVFDRMPERDMFTWTIMIAGYTKHGYGTEAVEIYGQMQSQGVDPDRVTFTCVLNACASLQVLEKGKRVHADLSKSGITPDIILESTLVDMYAKCRSMKDARQVFDNMAKRNVVSWSVMIAGYSQHGYSRESLEMYEQMQREGVMPDWVTFICVLNACVNLGALEKGKRVHNDIIKAGIVSHINLENTLVHMYAKCGSMKDACRVFDNMTQRDVVSWNAIIAGYAQHMCDKEALENYEQMQRDGVSPDTVTFTCVINICASLGALDKGKMVHNDIRRSGIAPDVILGNSLVDMYAKCGSVNDAHQVFNSMAKRDAVSWSAMIAGCAQHGGGKEALQLFEQMQQEGLHPNGITFVSLLSACSHVGLVDEGRHYFDCMTQYYGLAPTAKHYGCMVDLLGRAGQLDEAEDFIKTTATTPDMEVWRVLLGACGIHGDVEVAERAAKSILKSNPQHTGAYVLPLNIYAAAGRLEDKAKVRKMMEDTGARKEQERSCIEVDNQVHMFVEDKVHP